MRLIKRSHRHINPETLSEYLDGRLQGSALEQVDQQLGTCQLCREELESLRWTTTMLQELPEEAPRRSFVMTAAPMPAPIPSPPFQLPNLLRVPQWAYAGAASVAVLVLVALISADVTGLLSSEGPAQLQDQATAISQRIQAQSAESGPPTRTTGVENLESAQVPSSLPSEAGDEERPAAAPLAPAAAQAPAEEAPSAASAPAAAAPVQEPQAPAPVAMAADAPSEEPASAAPPAKELEPEAAAEALGPRGDAAAVQGVRAIEGEDASSAPPQVERVPATAPIPAEAPRVKSEGTALVWRVLEGVAGFLGVVFLVALGLRWRLSRNT